MKEPTNFDQYAELRTILDSLQTGALRYYLETEDPYVRQLNFDYLYKHLMPIINQRCRSAERTLSDDPATERRRFIRAGEDCSELV